METTPVFVVIYVSVQYLSELFLLFAHIVVKFIMITTLYIGFWKVSYKSARYATQVYMAVNKVLLITTLAGTLIKTPYPQILSLNGTLSIMASLYCLRTIYFTVDRFFCDHYLGGVFINKTSNN